MPQHNRHWETRQNWVSGFHQSCACVHLVSLAADQGNDVANKSLRLVKPRMTADELQRAQTLFSNVEGMSSDND